MAFTLPKILKSEIDRINESGFTLVDGVGKDDLDWCLNEIKNAYEQHYNFDYFITPGQNVGLDKKYAFFARSRK